MVHGRGIGGEMGVFTEAAMAGGKWRLYFQLALPLGVFHNGTS